MPQMNCNLSYCQWCFQPKIPQYRGNARSFAVYRCIHYHVMALQRLKNIFKCLQRLSETIVCPVGLSEGNSGLGCTKSCIAEVGMRLIDGNRARHSRAQSWPYYSLDSLRIGKERKWTCIAPIVSNSTTKRSDMDHTDLPVNTPHLPFLRLSIRQRATLLLTVSPIQLPIYYSFPVPLRAGG